MSPFRFPAVDETAPDQLVEALDRVAIGMVFLDRERHVRFVNRGYVHMFSVPPRMLKTTVTLRMLLEQAGARWAPRIMLAGSFGSVDDLEAMVGAGPIRSAHMDLRDERRILFACDTCRDGGRILTYVDVSMEPRSETFDAIKFLNAELQFNNETMADHAAHLASLAEETDQTARDLERARKELEREIDERRQLEARLRVLATTDGLTGALNRPAFLETSQSRLQAKSSTGRTHAVLMLDVDYFKAINDRYGHAGGDVALRHLVSLLSGQIRQGDFLGRLGGEEFAVLLSDVVPANAERIANRLVILVHDSPVAHGNEGIHMTVSIGVAFANDTDHSIDQVIGRADAALYRAKADGRNRVVTDSGGSVS